MKFLKFFGVCILFALPVAFLSNFLDFDKASAIVFAIVVAIVLYINREKVQLQKIAFPVLYLILIRTKIGLKLMDKLAKKYNELIKLLGLCFIGLGFFGMLYISAMFFILIYKMIQAPLVTSQGVALVLPFTNVPGVGYLSFWYFIIGIFFIATIHEFAHGVMARAHKLKVESSGIGFFGILLPIIPLAFVEPKEEELRKQKDHVQYSIFAAGPAINIIIALILALLLPFTVNPYAYAPFEEKITEPKGISFSDVQEDYPAAASGLEGGIIINQIDDRPIENYENFITYLYTTEPGQNITLHSKEQAYQITLTSYPENQSDWGYLGVVGAKNEREVKPEYMNIKTPFYWFKGLFRWLFILNFIIGLMNLLPIFITDGGRMLQLALNKMFKDQKKAAKLYSMIASVFLLTILIALLINYGSKLIGLG